LRVRTKSSFHASAAADPSEETAKDISQMLLDSFHAIANSSGHHQLD